MVSIIFIFFYFIIDNPPKWSSYYYVEGDIFIPFAEVHEPFQAWYDLESSNSRIDYYSGNFINNFINNSLTMIYTYFILFLFFRDVKNLSIV